MKNCRWQAVIHGWSDSHFSTHFCNFRCKSKLGFHLFYAYVMFVNYIWISFLSANKLKRFQKKIFFSIVLKYMITISRLLLCISGNHKSRSHSSAVSKESQLSLRRKSLIKSSNRDSAVLTNLKIVSKFYICKNAFIEF